MRLVSSHNKIKYVKDVLKLLKENSNWNNGIIEFFMNQWDLHLETLSWALCTDFSHFLVDLTTVLWQTLHSENIKSSENI